MFKVNIKDNITTCSSASIVNFEQVNANWVSPCVYNTNVIFDAISNPQLSRDIISAINQRSDFL